MGYLLKEALKTLCGLNQWSYAVFWKFGCQNPKLLIWEESFYEPVSYSNHPGISEFVNLESGFNNWDTCLVSAEAGPSHLAAPAGNKVDLLVNKMMMENHVSVVGEGLVGRAAFTGNHQWILSKNYSGVADPPEVIKEVYQQFSAGMQTVAVIPVLPHGVVQLGSCLPIPENLGFVNDVKTLVRHLGCVPGVLLSDNYTTTEPEPSFGLPVYHGKTLSIDASVRSDAMHSTPFIGNFNNQVSSTQSLNVVQDLGKSHDEHFQAKNRSLTKPNLPSISQLLNEVTKAEVIPSNHEWLNQQASFYNPSSTFEQQPCMMDNLTTSHFKPCGSLTGHQSAGNIGAKTEVNQKKEAIENNLFQGISIPLPQHDGKLKLSDDIPGFSHGNGKLEYDDACMQQSGDDLFDILGIDFKHKLLNGSWDNIPNNGTYSNAQDYKNKSTSELYSVNQGNSESGIFSAAGSDNLLDAVVSSVHHSTKQTLEDNVSCKTTLTNISNSSGLATSHSYSQGSGQMPGELFGFPKSLLKAGALGSTSFKSGSSKDNGGTYSESSSIYGSQISSWVEQSHDIKQSSSASTSYTKKPDEMSKSNRKRLKPGENPRPRPKDRQMIQDRVKELREIVPNGAKCSIDALLERTIKHMLFLQSVAKHADKLKQTGESKILSKDGGLLLKDNYEGGATWAYEVGSQSTVCPIIVEDLNQPRQMLVEMLCEERGLFLEIADIIRGLGLTILKGVMETRNGKIWARFAVEANRDVTRMEIFISLVRLLEQTAKNGAPPTNGMDNDAMMAHQFHQAASIPASGNPCGLQ